MRLRGFHKKENPAGLAAGFSGKNPGDDLLSHGLGRTTIGAAAFHFRVRDGIGWFHSANFTRETVGASLIPIKIGVAPVSHKVLGSSLLFRFSFDVLSRLKQLEVIWSSRTDH